MEAGRIKSFGPKHPYGFIAPDHGGKDVYFNTAVLRRLDIPVDEIEVGRRVRFSTRPVKKGLEVVEMTFLDGNGGAPGIPARKKYNGALQSGEPHAIGKRVTGAVISRSPAGDWGFMSVDGGLKNLFWHIRDFPPATAKECIVEGVRIAATVQEGKQDRFKAAKIEFLDR